MRSGEEGDVRIYEDIRLHEEEDIRIYRVTLNSLSGVGERKPSRAIGGYTRMGSPGRSVEVHSDGKVHRSALSKHGCVAIDRECEVNCTPAP